MKLAEHAKAEMTKAGLFDELFTVGQAVQGLVEYYEKQHFSGMFEEIVLSVFNRVVRFQTLSPLTSNPSEWTDVSDTMGEPMWQSKRDPLMFSRNGGQTWFGLYERKQVNE